MRIRIPSSYSYSTGQVGTVTVTVENVGDIISSLQQNANGYIIILIFYIDNISSITDCIALALYSAYVSTKFAVEGLSESMTYVPEQFGIKFAIIEPGGIKTNFRREQAAKGSGPYSSMMQSSSIAIEKMRR